MDYMKSMIPSIHQSLHQAGFRWPQDRQKTLNHRMKFQVA